jgi:hypothetical protein
MVWITLDWLRSKLNYCFAILHKYAPCYACQHMLISCARITEKWWVGMHIHKTGITAVSLLLYNQFKKNKLVYYMYNWYLCVGMCAWTDTPCYTSIACDDSFCNLPACRSLCTGKFPYPVWSLYSCPICILSDISWWARSQTFVFWTIRRLYTSVGRCYETGNVCILTFWNT